MDNSGRLNFGQNFGQFWSITVLAYLHTAHTAENNTLTKIYGVQLLLMSRCEGTEKQEETNEYDRNAVSIVFGDCISKKVVEYVPFNWSK